MHPLRGAVQHYDWGDRQFIPSLLNQDFDDAPCAEWWLGTHPLAPSKVVTAAGEQWLTTLVGEMNVLVKVLSAAAPLSLQTHPTRAQAQRGFARENEAGIPIADSRRIYKDANDKPEILIALTDFSALCGFAPLESSTELLEEIGLSFESLKLRDEGIGGYLGWALTQSSAPRFALDRCPDWLADLVARHPDDAALRIAPLLHHVILKPGQAIALPAGNLHAYLKGSGVEVMTSSDNVVRAGFTSKHVDVHELMHILDVSILDDPIVSPSVDGNVATYPCPTPAFGVQLINVHGSHTIAAHSRPRIVLCTEGETDVLSRGQAAVILPDEEISLNGSATVWLCRGD